LHLFGIKCKNKSEISLSILMVILLTDRVMHSWSITICLASILWVVAGGCVRHVEGGRSPVRSTEANSVARNTPTRAKRGARPRNDHNLRGFNYFDF